jgi:hypothetical protein
MRGRVRVALKYPRVTPANPYTPYIETIEHRANYSRLPLDIMGGEEQYEVEAIRSH